MHTVMVYRGHCVIKHNSWCIKTYLQRGTKTHICRRAFETKAGAATWLLPPTPHGITALCCQLQGMLPRHLGWEGWLLLGISVVTAVPTFKTADRFLWIALLSQKNLRLSLFVAFFFFSSFPRARDVKPCQAQKSFRRTAKLMGINLPFPFHNTFKFV